MVQLCDYQLKRQARKFNESAINGILFHINEWSVLRQEFRAAFIFMSIKSLGFDSKPQPCPRMIFTLVTNWGHGLSIALFKCRVTLAWIVFIRMSVAHEPFTH